MSAETQQLFFALLVLLAASILGPMLAVRLRLPSAVVLILFGVLLGPAGLSIVSDLPSIKFVSQFGFLVLMFMAGLEIDFHSLRAAGVGALRTPLLLVAAIGVCCVVSGHLLGIGSIGALILSAMAVGLPLAALKEAKLASAPIGRHIMLTLSLGEFVCIVGLTLIELVSGGETGFHLVIRVAKICGLFLIAGLVIRLSRALVWWHPASIRRLTAHHDVAELGVRIGLFVMLAGVLISAQAGVEAILGAFLGGMLVALVLRQKEILEGKLAALGNGLFIPIFFITVGLRFEARSLDRASVLRALLLAAVAGLCKIVPSLLFSPRGSSLRFRIACGCLFSAPLTLIVAIAAIGRDLNLLDGQLQATMVLVAMLLSVVFPTLFKLIAPPPPVLDAGHSQQALSPAASS
jgi:Kef-type K+ transport system membrane component KefB